MAQRRPRYRHKSPDWRGHDCTGRRRRVVKPIGWPRYMLEKPLKGGGIGYFWNPQKRDIDAGFTLHREALGPDYSQAVARQHAECPARRLARGTGSGARAGSPTRLWNYGLVV